MYWLSNLFPSVLKDKSHQNILKVFVLRWCLDKVLTVLWSLSKTSLTSSGKVVSMSALFSDTNCSRSHSSTYDIHGRMFTDGRVLINNILVHPLLAHVDPMTNSWAFPGLTNSVTILLRWSGWLSASYWMAGGAIHSLLRVPHTPLSRQSLLTWQLTVIWRHITSPSLFSSTFTFSLFLFLSFIHSFVQLLDNGTTCYSIEINT